MTLLEYRKAEDLSQEALARLLGLRSKSYICAIENTGRASVHVALKVEKLTEGAVKAESLNPNVALIRAEAVG
jgi:transcriptional regulator with XRE-family HTH domain